MDSRILRQTRTLALLGQSEEVHCRNEDGVCWPEKGQGARRPHCIHEDHGLNHEMHQCLIRICWHTLACASWIQSQSMLVLLLEEACGFSQQHFSIFCFVVNGANT